MRTLRDPFAPYTDLSDGDRYLIPGQRAPLAVLIRDGRVVAMSMPWSIRLRSLGAALLNRSHRP